MNLPWITSLAMHGANKPLTFPNHCRSFDPAHGTVSFWGYAATIEVTFLVPVDTLKGLLPSTVDNEASLLNAFDTHRDVIERAARAVYGRNRQTFIRLSQADF
jgi:hypothetical protein